MSREWEYLKCKIGKFSKTFCQEAACSNKIKSSGLETKLKVLASKIRFRDDPQYIHCKEELEKLYQEKINGATIRSSCKWYEPREKSSKFFINLEKNCAVQNQIRTTSCSHKEITNEKEINSELFKFYEALFEPKINVSYALIQDYLNRIEIPKPTIEQLQRSGGVITEDNIIKLLK